MIPTHPIPGVEGVALAEWSQELALATLRANRAELADDPGVQELGEMGARVAAEVTRRTGVSPGDASAVLLLAGAFLYSALLDRRDVLPEDFGQIMQCAADDLDQQATANKPKQRSPAFTVTVYGRPAPQGSKTSYGRGRVAEVSTYVKPWRESVKGAALSVIQHHRVWVRLDGPLVLDVQFFTDRHASHFGTGRNTGVLKASAPGRPTAAPDLSKLIRSTEDALTDAGVWRDDSRVTEVRSAKRYVGDTADSLPTPGAVIRVWRWSGDSKENTP